MSYSAFPTQDGSQWPTKQPGSAIDYSYDAIRDLTDPVSGKIDPLAQVSLAAAPSGAGELAPLALSVNGTTIVGRLGAGVPGRNYTVTIQCQGESGQVYVFSMGLLIDPWLASFPLPTPPFAGDGPSLTWAADGVLGTAGPYLSLMSVGAWPSGSAGLMPGQLYAASPAAPAFVFAVEGFEYVPTSAPVILSKTTGAALLAMNASVFPATDPHVDGQIWINGEILCVSQG